jgi:hypothetical protein
MALGIHEPGVTEVALKEWLPVMTLAGFGFGAGMSLPRKDFEMRNDPLFPSGLVIPLPR